LFLLYDYSLKEPTMDAATIICHFQDHLAPRLDTYEQAIYLYCLRHSRLIGHDTVTVGFKSARSRMAFGTGEAGKPMAEASARKRVHSLVHKGCLEVLEITRQGSIIRVRLPEEIPGCIPPPASPAAPSLEDADFFTVPENRLALLRRESYRCFYCFRAIDSTNFVVEHVLSRPSGSNSYRNLVAACHQCNNRKSDSPADDFLRDLYRSGTLTAAEFHDRLGALRRLRRGELTPPL
jgi:hypothetical protein